MDYNALLKKIYTEIRYLREEGDPATYIPELASLNPNKFGMFLQCIDGQHYALGDYHKRFSIQSISKVLSLTLAIAKVGESFWDRVKVEPSGTPFNSLVQLEYENGIPRNPFINAGAIVVCDILISNASNAKQELLDFIRDLADEPSIHFNIQVATSEKEYGFRNYALANFLKSFNNLDNSVEEVLDLYFHMCSIEMSCQELAKTFLFFANHGKSSRLENIITKSQTRRLNALMLTCGFYDESGEFSYKVGLPGKSGVGGGIVAIHSQKYSVAVWSPRLNKKGNSLMGMKALELLTSELESSIF